MILTAEQLEQIRRNKDRALQIRAEKERQRQQSTTSLASSSVVNATVSHPLQTVNAVEDSPSPTKRGRMTSPTSPTHIPMVHGETSRCSGSNMVSIDSSEDCVIIDQTSTAINPIDNDIEVLEEGQVEACREAHSNPQINSVAPSSVLLSSPERILTEEQKLQIERNRERALQIREQKSKERDHLQQGSSGSTTVSPTKEAVDQKRLLDNLDPETQPSSIVVNISLADSRSVAISFKPYHEEIAKVLQKIRVRRYNRETRITQVLFADWKRLEFDLRRCERVKVMIHCTVPDDVRRILMEPIPYFRRGPGSIFQLRKSCGPELIDMAFEYQLVGIQFSIQRNGRVLIADEMGLGKTIQALGAARYFSSDWPLVVICPASVTAVWRDSISKFLGSCIQPDQVTILSEKSHSLPTERLSTTVIIMSYDQMVRRETELKEAKYAAYIFDESHMIKNPKAQRTKTATELAKLAKRVILLSGTPALACPAEMFSQIRLIAPYLFTSYKKFAMRYCEGEEEIYGLTAKGCSNCEELCAILSKRIMIRRLKKDVMNLPKKTRRLIILSPDKVDTNTVKLVAARKQYEEMKRKSKSKSDRNKSLLKYYSETGVVKAEPVAQQIIETYFGEDNEERQKIIVFAHHQVVLDKIQEELAKKDLSFIRIDGKMSPKKRSGLCDKFQNDPECQVAILSIGAAGVGITLTAATVVVFAELYWTPGNLHQAEDRAHRVGQDKEVFVQYMIAVGTADDELFSIIEKKMDILGQLNLNSETFEDADVTVRHQPLDNPGGERGSRENVEREDNKRNPGEGCEITENLVRADDERNLVEERESRENEERADDKRNPGEELASRDIVEEENDERNPKEERESRETVEGAGDQRNHGEERESRENEEGENDERNPGEERESIDHVEGENDERNSGEIQQEVRKDDSEPLVV